MRKKLGGALEIKLLISCGRMQPRATSSGPVGRARSSVTAAPGSDIAVSNPALDVGGSTQSETSVVAVGNVVCAAWNDSGEGFDAGFAGYGYSLDGGQTFTDGGTFPKGPTGDLSFGDPSLAYSVRDKAFYFASLSSQGLSLWRSNDSCQTFQYVGPIHIAFDDDKEMMAIDNTPTSPFYGRIYVGWTAFGKGSDINVASHSDSGGLTWSPPEDFPGSGTAGQGVYPAVAPNGDVYMALVNRGFGVGDHQDQWIWRSTDGGQSFQKRADIGTDQLQPEDDQATLSCGRQALTGDIRNLSSPQIVITRDLSAPVGYVVHAVYPYDSDGPGPDHSNVFYRRSVDGAASWSNEVRINDDTTSTDQFYPTIGVDDSGILAVSWYDRRLDSGKNLLFDRYVAVSIDAGVTWSENQRISDVSSDVAQTNPNFDGLAICYHGDYDQVAVSGGVAHIVWSDDRRETIQGPNPDVYYDQFAANLHLGRLSATKSALSCAGSISFALSDSDLAGTGSAAIGLTTSNGDTETLVLTEVAGKLGSFVGSIASASGSTAPNDGALQVVDGATVTATYQDADDGSGHPAVATTQVRADCAAPSVSNPQVVGLSGNGATLSIQSSEPASLKVEYGYSCDKLLQVATSGVAPAPTATLANLYPGITYYYALVVTDAVGNSTRDDNGGACHSFQTLDVIAVEDFEHGLRGYVFDNDSSGSGGAGGVGGSDDGSGGKFSSGGTFASGGSGGKFGAGGSGGKFGAGGTFASGGSGGTLGSGGKSGAGGSKGGATGTGGALVAGSFGTGGTFSEAGAGGEFAEAGFPEFGGFPGFGGFGSGGTGGNGSSSGGLWHLSDSCAAVLVGHSATHSIYYGQDSACNYDRGRTAGAATSPVIELSDARFATIEFDYFLGTEGGGFYDQASVEVSIDGGPFQVLSGNFTRLNQPEPDEPPTYRTRLGAAPAGRYALVENSGKWQHASEDISPLLAGLPSAKVQIRFRFDTIDGAINDLAGFYVDDVRVLGVKAKVPCSSDSQCDDGLFCNGTETCQNGFCSNGIPVTCTADDGVACTDAVCDEAARGCIQRPDDARCDDGVFCNGQERCNATTGCQSASQACPAGQFSCLVGVCEEQLKFCSVLPSNSVCDDGLFCNGFEYCDVNAGCRSGTPPCVDGVACTDDVCSEATFSCSFPPNNARCDDGLFCTGQEYCDGVQGCRTSGAPCGAGTKCDEAGDQCLPVCFTDTNSNQQAAGRAYQKQKAYFAQGSDDVLGKATDTTSLQGGGSYWTRVPSCPAPPTIDSVNVRVSGNVATVTGKASDPNNDIAKVHVTFWISLSLQVTFDATGTNNFSFSLGLPVGSHAVQVQAVDRAGFVSGVRGPFVLQVLDPQPPTINSLSATVKGSSVTVAGTASDPNDDIQRVEITILQSGAVVASKVATGTTSFSGTISDLATGSYSARAQAFDSANFASTFGEPIPVTISTSCFSTTNAQHRSANRAVLTQGVFHAVGSNDPLGRNAATVTALSGSGSYWTHVPSCP